MSGQRNTGSESGMILVVVLWTVAILALLVSAFNWSVRGGAGVLVSEITSAKRLAVLEAGLEIAAAEILANSNNTQWRANGDAHRFRFGDQDMTISVQDAGGLIDLNKADGKLLSALLGQFTASQSEAEQISNRILDWRDRDTDVRFRGAEDIDYQRAGLSRGSGDAEFMHKTQLTDVLGLDPVLYRQIAPFLTIYGRGGRVNADTAPPEVLLSLTALPTTAPDGSATTLNERSEDSSRSPTNPQGRRPDLGGAMIVRVVLLGDRGQAGQSLTAAILPAADTEAPYRVLSWDVRQSPDRHPAGSL